MPLPPSKDRIRIKLSRQDMCGISLAINRDFAPRFFRSRTASHAKTQFSTQELLAISREISREYTPSRGNMPEKLVLLTVSPKRLHAYWSVVQQPIQPAPEKLGQPAMVLRIYADPVPVAEGPFSEAPPPTEPEENWFDITINNDDGHQDIDLPESSLKSTAVRYRATLGEIDDDQVFIPLSHSNITSVSQMLQAQAPNELANSLTQFIMPIFSPASSAGKTTSGQGKPTSR